MVRILSIVFIIGCFIASPVFAQVTGLDPAFGDLIQKPEYQQQALEAAKKSMTWVKRPCDAVTFTGVAKMGISQKPEFDIAHNLIAGAWKQSVVAHGCGEDRQFNVLFLVDQQKQLRAAPLNPGTSRADPILQKDGGIYAVTAAGPSPKGCKDLYIADTKFITFESSAPNAPAPPWTEEWTINQCNDLSIVTMHFVPDATGTGIHTVPKETRHETLAKH